MYRTPLILLVLFFLGSCRHTMEVSDSDGPTFTEIPSPAGAGGEPNLFVSADGQAYLSWIGYPNDSTDVLYFSKLESGQWGQAKKIAEGTNWFVNWADFPSLAVFHGQADHLAAHWLQMSAEGTYDYDVRIAQTSDGGKSWGAAFIPHSDGIAAEHGFVTLLPLENGRMLAVWLDGRNSKGHGNHDAGGHGHGGAMTLRSAEFDTSGQLYTETELDERVCDCCQTDAVLTDSGPIVIYRDRSEDDIRDISMVKYKNGAWTKPRPIYSDNWEIKGCPVNGPAIAAQGQSVAIAWYTAANNQPRVKVILSSDGGDSFTEPFVIDDGSPLGRVDVVWSGEKTAIVSWLEELPDGGEIRLAKVTAEGKTGDSMIATKTGVSRQSGFPILERRGEEFLLVWTSVEGAESTVRSMSITL